MTSSPEVPTFFALIKYLEENFAKAGLVSIHSDVLKNFVSEKRPIHSNGIDKLIKLLESNQHFNCYKLDGNAVNHLLQVVERLEPSLRQERVFHIIRVSIASWPTTREVQSFVDRLESHKLSVVNIDENCDTICTTVFPWLVKHFCRGFESKDIAISAGLLLPTICDVRLPRVKETLLKSLDGYGKELGAKVLLEHNFHQRVLAANVVRELLKVDAKSFRHWIFPSDFDISDSFPIRDRADRVWLEQLCAFFAEVDKGISFTEDDTRLCTFHLRDLDISERNVYFIDSFVIGDISDRLAFLLPASPETALEYVQIPLKGWTKVEMGDVESRGVDQPAEVVVYASGSGSYIKDAVRRALSNVRMIPITDAEELRNLLEEHVRGETAVKQLSLDETASHGQDLDHALDQEQGLPDDDEGSETQLISFYQTLNPIDFSQSPHADSLEDRHPYQRPVTPSGDAIDEIGEDGLEDLVTSAYDEFHKRSGEERAEEGGRLEPAEDILQETEPAGKTQVVRTPSPLNLSSDPVAEDNGEAAEDSHPRDPVQTNTQRLSASTSFFTSMAKILEDKGLPQPTASHTTLEVAQQSGHAKSQEQKLSRAAQSISRNEDVGDMDGIASHNDLATELSTDPGLSDAQEAAVRKSPLPGLKPSSERPLKASAKGRPKTALPLSSSKVSPSLGQASKPAIDITPSEWDIPDDPDEERDKPKPKAAGKTAKRKPARKKPAPKKQTRKAARSALKKKKAAATKVAKPRTAYRGKKYEDMEGPVTSDRASTEQPPSQAVIESRYRITDIDHTSSDGVESDVPSKLVEREEDLPITNDARLEQPNASKTVLPPIDGIRSALSHRDTAVPTQPGKFESAAGGLGQPAKGMTSTSVGNTAALEDAVLAPTKHTSDDGIFEQANDDADDEIFQNTANRLISRPVLGLKKDGPALRRLKVQTPANRPIHQKRKAEESGREDHQVDIVHFAASSVGKSSLASDVGREGYALKSKLSENTLQAETRKHDQYKEGLSALPKTRQSLETSPLAQRSRKSNFQSGTAYEEDSGIYADPLDLDGDSPGSEVLTLAFGRNHQSAPALNDAQKVDHGKIRSPHTFFKSPHSQQTSDQQFTSKDERSATTVIGLLNSTASIFPETKDIGTAVEEAEPDVVHDDQSPAAPLITSIQDKPVDLPEAITGKRHSREDTPVRQPVDERSGQSSVAKVFELAPEPSHQAPDRERHMTPVGIYRERFIGKPDFTKPSVESETPRIFSSSSTVQPKTSHLAVKFVDSERPSKTHAATAAHTYTSTVEGVLPTAAVLKPRPEIITSVGAQPPDVTSSHTLVPQVTSTSKVLDKSTTLAASPTRAPKAAVHQEVRSSYPSRRLERVTVITPPPREPTRSIDQRAVSLYPEVIDLEAQSKATWNAHLTLNQQSTLRPSDNAGQDSPVIQGKLKQLRLDARRPKVQVPHVEMDVSPSRPPRRIIERIEAQAPTTYSPQGSIASEASFFTKFRQENARPEPEREPLTATRKLVFTTMENSPDEGDTTLIAADSEYGETPQPNRSEAVSLSSSDESHTYLDLKTGKERRPGDEWLSAKHKYTDFVQTVRSITEEVVVRLAEGERMIRARCTAYDAGVEDMVDTIMRRQAADLNKQRKELEPRARELSQLLSNIRKRAHRAARQDTTIPLPDSSHVQILQELSEMESGLA